MPHSSSDAERRFLPLTEAAIALEVSDPTLRSWISSGFIKAIPYGKRLRIPRTEIDRIQREGTSPRILKAVTV